jgi:4-nitrophenyl phosphatase
MTDYKKFAKAFSYLRDNEGCHFILTNQDATFPTHGTVYPGSGAMSAPLVFASKRTPTVVGKPNTTMMDAIIAECVTGTHHRC